MIGIPSSSRVSSATPTGCLSCPESRVEAQLKSGFPGGDLLRAGGAANSIYRVQVHGWQPTEGLKGA